MRSLAFWRRFFFVRARLLVTLCAAGLLLGTLAPWLDALPQALAWLLDLLVHWQWLYLGGLVLGAVLAAWTDRRWLAALLLLPLPWMTISSAVPSRVSAPLVLSLASANVHFMNHDPHRLEAWVQQKQPDVLVILEISPEFAAGLQHLPAYSFRQIVAQDDSFGITVLSRLPLSAVRVLRDPDQIPRLEADIEVAGHPVRLFAEHPMPPISADYHQRRDQKIAARAKAAQQLGMPAVLVGDLNATPWSVALHGADRLGLQRATGRVPTWPALESGAGRFLPGIPIDNVLLTRHWAVLAQERGPWIGSDHYPVLVRLAWRADAGL